MRHKILLMLAAVAITLLVGEALLRMIGKPDDAAIFMIGWNSSDVNDQLMPVNQLGFRGQPYLKRQNDTAMHLLLIGDSQVEANGSPYEFMLESLLNERLLPAVKVFTLGSGGYGQDQQLLALKEYFRDYDADHVMLWFTPENDIWNNMFPTHWPWDGNPKPTFWLENDSLKGPSNQFRETLKFHTDIKVLRIVDIIRESRRMGNLDSKWEKRLPPATPINFTDDIPPSFSAVDISAQEELLREKSHYTIFQQRRTKRMEYGIQLTRKLLEEIRQVCEQNGAGFSIFYIDSQFIRDVENDAYVKDPQSDQYYRLERSAYLRTVKEILEGFDVRFINLQTPWRAISMQDRFHLNHEAQKELADSLQVWMPGIQSMIDK